MQFVAARWTAKGNLVLTAGTNTPLHFLCQNMTTISKLVAQTLQLPLVTLLRAEYGQTLAKGFDY